MVILFLMGISSGIPLLIIGSTLQAWLQSEGIDLTVIGIFSLTGLPYTIKFLWAPILDRFVPPFLGRRRGWAIMTQVILMGVIFALGIQNPGKSLWIPALLALSVSFFSATQDIALDAYRREILPDEELGLGSSIFINGYRIGMLFSGGGALLLADRLSWSQVYLILSISMILGITASYFAPTPKENITPPLSLKEAVLGPFVDYFKRKGAFEILAFIFLYKIGDTMASAMTTPFILEMGFSKTELGLIGNTWGMAATILGGLLGGLLILRLGIFRALLWFGFFQMISTLSFSCLAFVGKQSWMLATAVGLENITGGMGTSAYAAYIASLCNKRFTGTQYALLSSLMGIPRVLAAAPTGFLAKEMGWGLFFIFCTALAIPGLMLLVRLSPMKSKNLS
jgi:PAT family beta-lactamase induction signal transducer AmpG